MAKKAKSTQMKQPGWLNRLLHATPSLVFRGLVGIVLGYAFLSRAFDTGSYWQYLGAIVFTVLGLRLLKRSFTNSYGRIKAKKAR